MTKLHVVSGGRETTASACSYKCSLRQSAWADESCLPTLFTDVVRVLRVRHGFSAAPSVRVAQLYLPLFH